MKLLFFEQGVDLNICMGNKEEEESAYNYMKLLFFEQWVDLNICMGNKEKEGRKEGGRKEGRNKKV